MRKFGSSQQSISLTKAPLRPAPNTFPCYSRKQPRQWKSNTTSFNLVTTCAVHSRNGNRLFSVIFEFDVADLSPER